MHHSATEPCYIFSSGFYRILDPDAYHNGNTVPESYYPVEVQQPLAGIEGQAHLQANIFLPVFHGAAQNRASGHWLLALLQPHRNTMWLLDPFGDVQDLDVGRNSYHPTIVETLQRFLTHEFHRCNVPLLVPTSHWTVHLCRHPALPDQIQGDAWNCGVFVVMYTYVFFFIRDGRWPTVNDFYAHATSLPLLRLFILIL